MEQCKEKEGYLLIYADGGDEIHINLIDQDHYNHIMSKWPTDASDTSDAVDEAAFSRETLYDWFSQTMCNENWPYKNVKILGTVHIWAL